MKERKTKHQFTFITISYTVEIYIITFFEEKKAQPGIKCIYWNNEQDPNDISLLIRICVES